MSGTYKLLVIIAHRRRRLAGHVLGMENHLIPKTAMTRVPPGAKRQRGRPRKIPRRTFIRDLRVLNITRDDSETLARDRKRWRELTERCAT